MERLLGDLRLSVREMRRRPLASVVAVVTLALGIGAVTATFSVVDAVLLRPLPYAQPERLVAVWTSVDGERWRSSGALYADLRDAQPAVRPLAAFGSLSATLTGRGEPLALRGATVTSSYFETLGVQAVEGRLISAADAPGDRVAVVSTRLAQERFGGAAAAVGATLTLDGNPFVVLGVLPPGVYPTWPINGPRMHFHPESQDVFVPMPRNALTRRGAHVLGVFGRLGAGVGIESARATLEAAARHIASENPDFGKESVWVGPLVDEAVGNTRRALLLLLGAAALVLLIALANVGALLVGRASERRQEIAIRRALGAETFALVRRSFADGLLLATLGCGAGALTAGAALGPIRRLVPQEIPRLAGAMIDVRVLLLVAGIAAAASLALALLPLATSSLTAESLRDGARGAGAGAPRQRLRALLVAGQIALAVALAIGAALLAQTFRRLARIDPGVVTDGVLTVDLNLGGPRYQERSEVERFQRDVLAGIRALPGVRSTHLAYDHPLESNWMNGFTLPGRTERPELPWGSDLRFVTPGYFGSLEIERIAGREFESSDRADAPGVAVVDEEFARRFLAGSEPVGTVLETSVGRWNWGDAAPVRFEIVGVVGNVISPEPGHVPQPTLYLSLDQIPQRQLKLLVRTVDPGLPMAAAVRERIREVDAAVPIVRMRELAEERRRAIAQPRFNLELMSAFGVLAVLLAAIGVYGVLAAWVGARRREIGVRMALGAGRSDVLWFVGRHGGRLALVGVAAGCALAVAGSRLLASQLHGVSVAEPTAWLTAPFTVLAAAALAALVPAWRAVHVPPSEALTAE